MVNLKKIPEGFKETEVGIIPNDWRVLAINDVSEVRSGKRLPLGKSLTDKETDHFYIRVADMSMGSVSLNDIKYLPNDVYPSIKNYCIFNDDIFISVAGTLGLVGKIPPILNGANLTENADRLTNISCVRDYLLYVLMSWLIQNKIEAEKTLGAQPKLALARIRKFQIPLPPTKAEQTAIATALNDVDSLITQLEKLIAKKRAVKQGAMQELLKPKRSWEGINLEKMTDCLDNLRLPLNETQRLAMQGDYPYCGANGILDYLNDYKINDDVILIAEDGGYFDEYATRPIAYKMKGKFWVNNHAHILKAKAQFDQNFIYYSLVHKNILDLLASGTRAKLNKSQMYKIKIHLPKEKEEQTRIAQILSDMDAEIEALEKKLDKYRMIKQGMMQVLLTGKVRLI